MATRKPTSKKYPKKSSASSSASGISSSQQSIYNKLKKKGMSDAQARAFSKQAAKRMKKK